jgi:hypothetical protein
MKRKIKLERSLLLKKNHLLSLPFLCWIYVRCRISFRQFRKLVNGSNQARKVNRQRLIKQHRNKTKHHNLCKPS